MRGSYCEEELIHRVVVLSKEGMSARAISRALRMGRNRVRRILRAHGQQRETGHSALPVRLRRRPSKLDEYADAITFLLARYPDITAQRVYESLQSDGYRGGYTIVRERVRELRPKERRISLPTPTHGPGEMGESDWSPYKVRFLAGYTRDVEFFGYALPWSRRKFFSVHEGNGLHPLMDGHVAAFERFGGVPAECKYDSQKPVVLRWEGDQPIFNPRFIAFATHYNFKPVACRRGCPNDKPRVERGFWEVERSFFNGRSFHDVDDLERQLAGWLDTTCDLRKPRSTGEVILERFAREQPHLRPLPRHAYDTARVVHRVCDAEGLVRWDGNLYEVPYEHVTDILPVRITARTLHVYAADLREVAVHELRPRGAGERAHLPGRTPPRRSPRPDRELLARAFASIGPHAAAYFEQLVVARPRSASHHARRILGQRERFASSDLDKGLRHALRYGVFEHQAIARILITRAAPRRLDEYVAETTRQRLERALGEDTTEARDLGDYDRLGLDTSSQLQDTPCHEHPNPTPRPSGSDSSDT